MANNPYMVKTEALLREGKAMLDGLRANAEKASAEARSEAQAKIQKLEARYADVSRRFQQLGAAGVEGVADLKVALEKAWDAFRSDSGWKPLEER
jgi:hypothetical protein